MIISGGENIYPTEIEHILSAHPSIHEIAVVGKPDEQWGHVPVAFIVGDETAEAAIKQFAETELASYKVPKAFYFIKTMPRTASNKVQRHRLIESMHKKS
ncbi:2-succinylbenzoate--CoA ligase [Listeria grayi]|uniref:2-succinylbenzoate--CoA ligase n=1 Tax=Listeria grayi TaxID=1641 RepID=A0A378MBY7_LISGR|nr:2-succinylbenzoate--CoA ligase [Listeria grayi]